MALPAACYYHRVVSCIDLIGTVVTCIDLIGPLLPYVHTVVTRTLLYLENVHFVFLPTGADDGVPNNEGTADRGRARARPKARPETLPVGPRRDGLRDGQPRLHVSGGRRKWDSFLIAPPCLKVFWFTHTQKKLHPFLKNSKSILLLLLPPKRRGALTRFLALHSGFRASDVEQVSVRLFLFSVFRKIAKGFPTIAFFFRG